MAMYLKGVMDYLNIVQGKEIFFFLICYFVLGYS